jgi:glutaminyl-peptide cyclotransferase
MEALQWEMREDSFTAQTPNGQRTFTNLVATQSPGAPRRLTFACHFDSKNLTSFVFIGATDSAVPCAMMLDMALTLHQRLFSPLNKLVRRTTKLAYKNLMNYANASKRDKTK